MAFAIARRCLNLNNTPDRSRARSCPARLSRSGPPLSAPPLGLAWCSRISRRPSRAAWPCWPLPRSCTPIVCKPNEVTGCVTRLSLPYSVTRPSPRRRYSAASVASDGMGPLRRSGAGSRGTGPSAASVTPTAHPSAGRGWPCPADRPLTPATPTSAGRHAEACTGGLPSRSPMYSSATYSPMPGAQLSPVDRIPATLIQPEPVTPGASAAGPSQLVQLIW
eukprot:scaffold24105_cov113-Isochrysis_galbana.AAC.2